MNHLPESFDAVPAPVEEIDPALRQPAHRAAARQPHPLPGWMVGEFIGTFLLVFFGCGSVATAVLTGAQVGIFQVAIVWGLGIAFAIHLTASLSGAHLNPAVTIAMAAWRGFPKRRVLPYIAVQLVAAFVCAAVLDVIFAGALTQFEAKGNIQRGQPGSEASAMIFGEYFPSPGGKPLVNPPSDFASSLRPAATEAIGTAVLLLIICGVTDEHNRSRPTELAPLLIGLTITALISLLGPLTMAAFNPARDLGARLFSACAGWGSLPFTVNGWGWLTVYIVGPITGGWIGAGIYSLLLAPHYARLGNFDKKT
jgi:glycerol uptake facilitator protein